MWNGITHTVREGVMGCQCWLCFVVSFLLFLSWNGSGGVAMQSREQSTILNLITPLIAPSLKLRYGLTPLLGCLCLHARLSNQFLPHHLHAYSLTLVHAFIPLWCACGFCQWSLMSSPISSDCAKVFNLFWAAQGQGANLSCRPDFETFTYESFSQFLTIFC